MPASFMGGKTRLFQSPSEGLMGAVTQQQGTDLIGTSGGVIRSPLTSPRAQLSLPQAGTVGGQEV